MSGDNGKKDKLMIRIWITSEGKIMAETTVNEKEFNVNLLADTLKIMAMTKDNVVPMSAQEFGGRLRKFLGRKKK